MHPSPDSALSRLWPTPRSAPYGYTLRAVSRSLLVSVLVLVLGGCSSYPAADSAADALASDAAVTVEVADPGLTAFLPTSPTTDLAIAFYPGGLVDADAYAPLLHQLAAAGVPSVLVAMPSNLAVLAPNKGDKAIEVFPDLGPWIAAGHSLGGAMAASWTEDRGDIAGLALLAAYPAGHVDLSARALPVLSVTASEDGVLAWDTWEERKANLPGGTSFVEVEGGNHAGFGAYGPQDGDGVASISASEQWTATVALLVELATAAGD